MRERMIELYAKVEQLRYMRIGISECVDIFIANGMEIPVHCCDCLKCTGIVNQVDGEPILFCEHWKGYPKVDPTDFCSYGERKDNG